ncbi:MAG: hypothetical protein QNJ31_07070 [Candidatus Caenarcaniphilales bacterium]|nr:hypothetical protein [Candidatus Caenarcaniphilales bacterium]
MSQGLSIKNSISHLRRKFILNGKASKRKTQKKQAELSFTKSPLPFALPVFNITSLLQPSRMERKKLLEAIIHGPIAVNVENFEYSFRDIEEKSFSTQFVDLENMSSFNQETLPKVLNRQSIKHKKLPSLELGEKLVGSYHRFTGLGKHDPGDPKSYLIFDIPDVSPWPSEESYPGFRESAMKLFNDLTCIHRALIPALFDKQDIQEFINKYLGYQFHMLWYDKTFHGNKTDEFGRIIRKDVHKDQTFLSLFYDVNQFEFILNGKNYRTELPPNCVMAIQGEGLQELFNASYGLQTEALKHWVVSRNSEEYGDRYNGTLIPRDYFTPNELMFQIRKFLNQSFSF